MTKFHFITAVIDAKQRRDIMTTNNPNACVQTNIRLKANGKRAITKIDGSLVNMLVDIALHCTSINNLLDTKESRNSLDKYAQVSRWDALVISAILQEVQKRH
jgi:hypothetical protein